MVQGHERRAFLRKLLNETFNDICDEASFSWRATLPSRGERVSQIIQAYYFIFLM